MSSIPQMFWFILISWEEIPSLFPRQKKNCLPLSFRSFSHRVFPPLIKFVSPQSETSNNVIISAAAGCHSNSSSSPHSNQRTGPERRVRRLHDRQTWGENRKSPPALSPKNRKMSLKRYRNPAHRETENQAQCHTEVLNKSLLQLPDHPVVMENQVDLDLGC